MFEPPSRRRRPDGWTSTPRTSREATAKTTPESCDLQGIRLAVHNTRPVLSTCARFWRNVAHILENCECEFRPAFLSHCFEIAPLVVVYCRQPRAKHKSWAPHMRADPRTVHALPAQCLCIGTGRIESLTTQAAQSLCIDTFTSNRCDSRLCLDQCPVPLNTDDFKPLPWAF